MTRDVQDVRVVSVCVWGGGGGGACEQLILLLQLSVSIIS